MRETALGDARWRVCGPHADGPAEAHFLLDGEVVATVRRASDGWEVCVCVGFDPLLDVFETDELAQDWVEAALPELRRDAREDAAWRARDLETRRHREAAKGDDRRLLEARARSTAEGRAWQAQFDATDRPHRTVACEICGATLTGTGSSREMCELVGWRWVVVRRRARCSRCRWGNLKRPR